jgi:hypothetical protein
VSRVLGALVGDLRAAKGQWAFLLCVATVLLSFTGRPGAAVELGQSFQTKPGIAIGAFAAPLPPGVYMVSHQFYHGFRLTGPGVVPNSPYGSVWEVDPGFLWYSGWKVLGADYSFYVSFPLATESIGSAANFPGISFAGMHNTFISPLRLHWNLGNGFFVQSGFGFYFPDGTIQGALGNSNIGAPYFTFQPHLVFSYVKDGWNITSYMYYEKNTKNEKSGYTTGDIFHADFTATKQFGQWTIGPVAYYAAQLTSDRPSDITDAALAAATTIPGIQGFNAGKFETFGIGGLLGYDFGAVLLQIWATKEVVARAFGGNSGTPLLNEIPFATDVSGRGWTIFSRLTYRIPDLAVGPPRKTSMVHK